MLTAYEMNQVSLTIVLSLASLCTSQIMMRSFDYENALAQDQNMWAWRSEASNDKTLRLVDETGNSRTELKLCLAKKVSERDLTLTIDNITYTNDGPKDVVVLTLNGDVIANWTTYEKCASGYGWNVPRYSGPLGGNMTLTAGVHTLTASIRTDEYGVEFDKIDVSVDNQDPDTEIFCGSSVYLVDS